MSDRHGRGVDIDGAGHGRRRSRIDKHGAGEDVMSGYVGHAKPVEAQREYVRQMARKVGGADAALLVEMLLGEQLTDWQVQLVDSALAGDLDPAPVVDIAGRRIAGASITLSVVDEIPPAAAA